MYEYLGSFVARRWWLILLGWVIAAVVIHRASPTWDQVTKDGDLAYLPSRMTSVRGEKLYGEAFPDNKSRSQIVVVLERDSGLTQADLDLAHQIADWLTPEKDKLTATEGEDAAAASAPAAEGKTDGDAKANGDPKALVKTHEMAIIETMRPMRTLEGNKNSAEDIRGKKLMSRDGKSAIVVTSLEHEFIAVDSVKVLLIVKKEVSEKVAAAIKSDPSMAGLQWGLTGSTAVGGDTLMASDESVKNIHFATATLVLLILLVVYRAPILVFVPVVTIGIAVFIAKDLVAALTQLGTVPGFEWFHFEIFKTSEIFIFVICFGSGTDFCLFLISRYKEELERGYSTSVALERSLGQVGEALVGSAFTTVCGLGMMFFSDFGKFTYSGPAIAMCLVATLLACLTFAPALLRACGRTVFWPFGIKSHPATVTVAHDEPLPDHSLIGRFWSWTSDHIMARPGLLLLVSLVVMTPFAYAGLDVKISYDLLADLPKDAESGDGTKLLKKHFPAGEVGPITMLVAVDPLLNDTNKDGKIELDEYLEAAKKEFQADDVNKDGVLSVDDGPNVDVLKSEKTGVLRGDQNRDGKVDEKEFVESRKKEFGFDDDNKDQVLTPEEVNLASSSNRLKIRDLTREMFKSMNGDVLSIRSLEYPLGYDGTGGVESAPIRLNKETIKLYVATAEGPRKGSVTRFDVITKYDPFSPEAENALGNLEKFAQAKAAEPDSLWHNASIDFIGTTAGTRDLKVVVTSDERLIQQLVVLAVFAVILSILRRPMICLYLIFTVVFSYLVTIGATELVFEKMYGAEFTGLDWKVPIFLFVILVAVGEDYNIYLATRIFEEEKRLGRERGLREAIIKTGGIITSCGVIMAGTFVSLMFGTLKAMHALGFALTLGVILDTFIVRPVLVPAFLAWLYKIMPERKPSAAPAATLLDVPAGEPMGEAAMLAAVGADPMAIPSKPHTESHARRKVKG